MAKWMQMGALGSARVRPASRATLQRVSTPRSLRDSWYSYPM